MAYASTAFYNRHSAPSREREELLRSEMPTTTLVRTTAKRIGEDLDDQRAKKLGAISHYAFGAPGGPPALMLQRGGADRLGAGLAVATAMEVVVDQGMNTALRLTPPPNVWPWQAHARGVGARHLRGRPRTPARRRR